MIAALGNRFSTIAGRPAGFAAAVGACVVVCLMAAGPLGDIVEIEGRIERSRDLLARTRAAALRPPLPVPLAGADADALVAALRLRLQSVIAGRAVAIDTVRLAPGDGGPGLVHLDADLHGTAEGLHGMLAALEAGTPLVAVETASLGVARAADSEEGRPTALSLSLGLRGVLLPAVAPTARTETAP